jgi:predicted nucleotide-binding protein
MSGFSGVLGIPIRIQAQVKNNNLEYNINIHKSLNNLEIQLYYVAKSRTGERDEYITLPQSQETEDRLTYISSEPLNTEDQALEVVLILNGKRITSIRIPSQREIQLSASIGLNTNLFSSHQSKIFIVHGRNHKIRDNIRNYLIEELKFAEEMIKILDMAPNNGRTLPEKFEDVAIECKFAIIILSGDDLLFNPLPQKRARQNVVLELGYFWGRLGRRNLAFLVDPKIEFPSDIIGVGYINLVKDFTKVKNDLYKELQSAGLVS